MASLNDRLGDLQIAEGGAENALPIESSKHNLSPSTRTSLGDLPIELLYAILEYCRVSDMVHMWHSSNLFARIITPFMLANKDVQQLALQTACNAGDNKLIRTIILDYNADPSFFQAEKYWPGKTGNGFEKMRSSTLATAARRGYPETFQQLINLGARLDTRHKKEHRGFARLLKSPDGFKYWRSILTSDYAHEFLEDEKIAFCLADQVNIGIPTDILKTLLDRGIDVNCSIGSGTTRTALTAALYRGSVETADLLVEYGAIVDVKYKGLGADWDDGEHPHHYDIPMFLPIFTAARYMAETGSTKELEWCLQHGVNINMQAVRAPGSHTNTYFVTNPLMVYLSSLHPWPVKTGLLPIEGIKFFQKHGADICLSETVDVDGEDRTLFCSKGRYTRYYTSALEILFQRPCSSKLHEPQYFECVMYLIQQGSGVDRTHFFLDEFGDSTPCLNPDRQNHPGLFKCTPQFWDVARELLNRFRQKHNYRLTWAVEFANLPSGRSIPKGLYKETTSVESVLENILLYNWGYWPQFYGTVNRLVLDMMILDGADLNGTINTSEQTILHAYCERIITLCNTLQSSPNETYTLPISSWGALSLRRDKITEFAVSLVDKGADPYKRDASGYTPIDNLLNYVKDKTGTEDEVWLSLLAGKMGETRSVFLEKGSTPNEEVYQVHLDRDNAPLHDWLGNQYGHPWWPH